MWDKLSNLPITWHRLQAINLWNHHCKLKKFVTILWQPFLYLQPCTTLYFLYGICLQAVHELLYYQAFTGGGGGHLTFYYTVCQQNLCLGMHQMQSHLHTDVWHSPKNKTIVSCWLSFPPHSSSLSTRGLSTYCHSTGKVSESVVLQSSFLNSTYKFRLYSLLCGKL